MSWNWKTSCLLALLCTGVLAVAGCDNGAATDAGGDTSTTDGTTDTATSELEGSVTIDGSSTVEPISSSIAGAFMEEYPNVKVSVGLSGTGGGFKRFAVGETEISDASRPIKDGEFENCRKNDVSFIEIPVAYDGLSIVVHPDNKFVKQMTVDDLKKIFLAPGAKTWQDVNADWPAEEIKVYAPGKDSGTFDYFFGDVVNKDEQGEPRSQGVSFNEDDNVLVQGIAREKNAIGFFGCSYYFANEDKLKVVPIVDPNTGKAVSPTPETIESGEYAPFSRPLFIYLNAGSLDSPAMNQFVDYYLSNVAQHAADVGYVALPDAIYEKAYSHFENRLAGTHFLTEDLEKRSGPLAELYVEENLVK